VVMPVVSGRELRDKIKEICPDIKALFMSGYISNVIVHRGVLDEGVHFIHKPFSMIDLRKRCMMRSTADEMPGKSDRRKFVLVKYTCDSYVPGSRIGTTG